MFNRYPTMSPEAVQALRAVNLLRDGGIYIEACEASPSYGIEQRFIRCAGTLDYPRLGLDCAKLDDIARNIREATGDPANYIMTSWHPDYGDYLRVRIESAAYRFLCYLKS